MATRNYLKIVNTHNCTWQEDSQEYQDACELWEIYEEVKAELLEETFGDLSDHYPGDSISLGPSQKGSEMGGSESDCTDMDEAEPYPVEQRDEKVQVAGLRQGTVDAGVSCSCVCRQTSVLTNRLVGLVDKASSLRAEDPTFNSRLRCGDFLGRVILLT